MSFSEILFVIAALMTLGGAVGATFVKNLMHACIFLLISLYGVAGLYVTLNANFLAMVQMIIYAGGVVILMLFAIMLTGGTKNATNRFGLEKIPLMGNIKTYSIAFIASGAIVYGVLKFSPLMNIPKKAGEMSYTVRDIGLSLLREHVLAFEISSILLLGVLIGAVAVAREEK